MLIKKEKFIIWILILCIYIYQIMKNIYLIYKMDYVVVKMIMEKQKELFMVDLLVVNKNYAIQ